MKDDTITTCLGMTLSVAVLLIVGTLADGWALSKIWNWFMPTIFNVTSLTLWQAIGVSMVFEIFSRTNKVQKNKSESSSKTFGEAFVSGLVEVVLTPVFSVGVAWVVLQFAF